MAHSTEIVTSAPAVPAVADELSIEQLTGQVQLVQQAMAAAMKDGVHYGLIPGTDKPTLFKPGAEKLLLLFRLAPDYDVSETWHDDGHYTVRVTCRLTHITTQNFMGAGDGLCTTRESRYAIRKLARVCPACGKEAIIKGKEEYGGGWLCFRKKGGCGAKFNDGDQVIEGQPEGEGPNDKIADTFNTVLKMGCKRALIAAVLNVTAASDIFTQDLEDSQASAAPSTPPASPKGSPENYRAMIASLEANDDAQNIWGLDTVLANAKRHFGRPLDSLQDLTDEEMESIISSARKWREENPIIVQEA